MAKILVAEDDPKLSIVIRDFLAMEHHNVEAVDNGGDALNRLKTCDYDLIVLDWDLPELSGLEILKDYRGRGGVAPVLMLTGKDSVSDKEAGLDAGADDYLTKPFNGRELLARLRALLRRPSAMVGNIVEFGGVKLDRSNYLVTRDGDEVSLLPREFDLLEFFMRNPNRVHATEALLNKVWADESDATVAAVTTCIKRLRRKIDPDGKPPLLATVHGVGYKLTEPKA